MSLGDLPRALNFVTLTLDPPADVFPGATSSIHACAAVPEHSHARVHTLQSPSGELSTAAIPAAWLHHIAVII